MNELLTPKLSIALPVVLIVLGLSPAAVRAQEPARDPISDELMRAIQNVALATLSFAEAVRPAIDRSAFEQDSLLDRLEFDDAEIVRFVREEIAYEPYVGVLRGAHGTLLARAGNALDQSVLLATLLNDAGFEAVIRGGTLPAAEAERLLRMLADRPAPPAAIDEAVIEAAQSQWDESIAALLEVESREGRELELTMEHVLEGIKIDRDELLAALDEAGVVLGDAAAQAGLVSEASEYFWVEYRDGPAIPWTAVHPAFGRASGPTVEAAATYAGDLPAELTHRLRLELVVEQRFGDEITTAALMDPMEFPSANVAGRSLTLMLLPDTLLRAEPAADGTSPEAETRFLVPLIDNGLPQGARALALNGTPVPPELIQVSPAGIFETVGVEFEAAASALHGLGGTDDDAEDLVAIESVRLLVTLVHPTQDERTIERVLYQAPGETPLDEGADETARRAALVSELARSHSLGFVTGSLSPAYVLDETLGELERIGPLIRALSDTAFECESLDCRALPELEPSPSGGSAATAVAWFDTAMPRAGESVLYRDAPNVVRVSRPLFPDTSPVPGVFDIVSNARRAFRLEPGGPVPAPDLVLLAGVAETHLERIQPGFQGLGSTIERPVGDRRARPLDVRSGDAAALDEGAAVETAMISDALSSRSVVITAARNDDRAELPLGWWEVDPRTGRTLGMARHGGQSLTEVVVLLGVVAGGTALVYTGAVCAGKPPRRAAPDGSGRIQTATWLSCTFCHLSSAITTVGFERRRDEVRFCIGQRGGWEYG